MLGNPEFKTYVEKKLDQRQLNRLKNALATSLEIPLTDRGLVQAANRDGADKNDDTNYDAIWVRDSMWVSLSFIETAQPEKARKLLLAIWDYYSTPHQQKRFIDIIQNPSLALDGGMLVPHIRFNGKSPDFTDVEENRKPQEWNHRQNDAHGLFLLGVVQGFKSGILKNEDLTEQRIQSLNVFVPYFEKIKFYNYSDAGAWEEINKINTSSIAMVVKSLENWRDYLKKNDVIKKSLNWKPTTIKSLIALGYERIRKNLALGGEAPDHAPLSQNYRREDAALFNIFLPMPLMDLSRAEKLLALTILEKLIRPYGVIRYPLDSYQSGNYWMKDKKTEGLPDFTGDTSSAGSFKARFQYFIPGTEAQWFFDSKLSMIYLGLATDAKDLDVRSKYQRLAEYHFKKALGQITPASGEVISADGSRVPNLTFPESINTVILDGKYYFLPSPITPLNWAKASFAMNLRRMQESSAQR